jgi:pimeloyl-[acyl-carrier protein] synthase
MGEATVLCTASPAGEKPLSLFRLYDPEVLANPYPFYHELQREDPVHWDPFLHAWVVTLYDDVTTVLRNFSAKCAPDPERLAEIGLSSMSEIGRTMVRQMLFMDPPTHTRLRGICSVAFTPHRVETLRQHIQAIVDSLLEPHLHECQIELMGDFANRLPAIVMAELLGVSTSDHEKLKKWSADFAEILGNLQHNADSAARTLRSLEEMSSYFQQAVREQRQNPGSGLIAALITAQVDGQRLSDESIIANCILLTVGGQETTPNLIGNGMLSLLRHPDQMSLLRQNPALLSSAIEELLRYEAPSQHTTRLAPEDTQLGSRKILKQQSVIAIMGAANRDEKHFPDPDRLDVTRQENRHLAFGAGAHFCFGAPLARLEGQIGFSTLLNLTSDIALGSEKLAWRENLGLRGLEALPLVFKPAA